MNYYAQGGQAHGLQTLAGHQIHTKDGVPAFGLGGWFQKNVMQPIVKPAVQTVKAVQNIPGIKQVSDISTQAIKPIDQAFVGLDKSVGKMIPGGWGTVAQVAGAAMGLPTYAMVGLGALNGSGVMHKGAGFNMQGALIGGASAYAMSELGDYLRAAAPGAEATTNMATLPESVSADAIAKAASNIDPSVLESMTAEQVKAAVTPTMANAALRSTDTAALNALTKGMESGAGAGLQVAPPPSIASQIMSGNFGDAFSQAGTNIADAASNAYTGTQEGLSSLGTKASNFYDAATTGDTYTQAIDKGMSNASQTGAGIKNLIAGPAGVSKAASALSGVNPMAMTGLAAYSTMSLADLDAQRDYLKQQQEAGNIAQADYDKAMAEIEASADIARKAVAEHPFSTTPSRDTSIGDTYYGRTGADQNLYERLTGDSRMYAVGGEVDDMNGMDEARGLFQGNMQNGFMGGGMPSYAMGGMPSYDLALRGLSQPAFNEGAVGGMQQFAAGGMPHFLSGGGDGMSDDIPATINGTQEARLADGEFVIPADVVSHLGNGSSKAGAKQLYSMMNKVRKARTGNPKQGKQINPRKYLPA